MVDTPGIELVAEEAAAAGAERLCIVTSPGKDGVVAHFVEDLVLEGTLEKRGKTAMLDKVRRAPNLIHAEAVIQEKPLGLGHAVACVEPVLDDDEDAVAVLLPDDLVLPIGVLTTMAKVREKRGGSVLCAIEVSRSRSAATAPSTSRSCPTPPTPTCSRSTAWSRSPRPRTRRRTTPLPAATCWTGPFSTRCAASTRGPAARSS